MLNELNRTSVVLGLLLAASLAVNLGLARFAASAHEELQTVSAELKDTDDELKGVTGNLQLAWQNNRKLIDELNAFKLALPSVMVQK